MTNGLCVGGECAKCNDPADDASCTTAYAMPSVCINGSCIAGDCRKDSDCAPGQLCGSETPNMCSNCTSDKQCGVDYGPTYICGSAGLCVVGTCTNTGEACAANPADVCCAGQCIPGNCCSAANCTQLTETCTSHVCTCAAPTNDTYYVDPLNGNDALATGGSALGGGCAFQSITRAAKVIGNNAAVGTRIIVLNTGAVGAAETFPISVPPNVTIEGQSLAKSPTVNVAATKNGFTMTSPSSALANLIIDGGAQMSGIGINVGTGATATTTVTNVTVQNTGGEGIEVAGTAVFTIGSGVKVTGAGTTTTVRSGLYVSGTAQVVMTINTGDTAPQFNANTQAGIAVVSGGSVTIGGTLSPAVIASANVQYGVLIDQVPAVAPATQAANAITNLEATGTTKGPGIQVEGGSSLKLRTSVTSANSTDGILFVTYSSGGVTSNDLTLVDLGTSSPSSPGGNTFQFPAGVMANASSGICVNVAATAAQKLEAAGNKFSILNCGLTAGTLTTTAGKCAAGTDYGINGASNTNTIDLTKCM